MCTHHVNRFFYQIPGTIQGTGVLSISPTIRPSLASVDILWQMLELKLDLEALSRGSVRRWKQRRRNGVAYDLRIFVASLARAWMAPARDVGDWSDYADSEVLRSNLGLPFGTSRVIGR